MFARLRTVMQRPRARLFAMIGVIAVGLLITVFFGLRSYRSFRELQYIQQQGLDRGTASVDAIRAWMTVRFVAVAYAVPEEYLYAQLDLPFEGRHPDMRLFDINRSKQLGTSPNGDYPAVIDLVKTAITEYRKNPVATGLRDIRPWMTVRYIANSTGVSEDTIFTAINVPASGNESKPLDLIAKEQKYPGGPRALTDAIANALGQPKAAP